jgi:hypothetical protein
MKQEGTWSVMRESMKTNKTGNSSFIHSKQVPEQMQTVGQFIQMAYKVGELSGRIGLAILMERGYGGR